jgi:phage gp36-like protein
VAAYATGNDLIARYDVRLVGDLTTDDGEELDNAVVPTHPNVLTALEDASGEIDVALTVGGAYTPAQLEALTGNTKKHLIRIACAIAMACLAERRLSDRLRDLAESLRKIANGHLTAIRRGENVFGITENIEAGTIDTATISALEVEALNGLTARMPRYFPSADTRLPRNY